MAESIIARVNKERKKTPSKRNGSVSLKRRGEGTRMIENALNPVLNVKIVDVDNKVLQNFCLTNTEAMLKKSRVHAECNPLKTYFTDLINRSKKAAASNEASEEKLHSINYLSKLPLFLNNNETLKKLLSIHSQMSVFFPTRDFMNTASDCEGRKRTSSTQLAFGRRVSMSQSRNAQSQGRSFAEREAAQDASKGLRRTLLERLAGAVAESSEECGKLVGCLEELVDVYLESRDCNTVVVVPKASKNTNKTRKVMQRKGSDRTLLKPVLSTAKESQVLEDTPLKIKELKADDNYALFKGLPGPRIMSRKRESRGRSSKFAAEGTSSYRRVTLGLLDKGATGLVCMRTHKSSKPAASIKIMHSDYNHLQNHPINTAIFHMNNLVSMLRSKELTGAQKQLAVMLGKSLSVALPSIKGELDLQMLKLKEVIHPLKEKILKNFFALINAENNYAPDVSAKSAVPRVHISSRNNELMIKTLFKNRWWWGSPCKSEEGASLCWTDFCNKAIVKSLPVYGSELKGSVRMYNHMEFHYHLTDKKELFKNMSDYYSTMQSDPFDVLPLTFHIQGGITDPEFKKFALCYNLLEKQRSKEASKNVWIVKLGENSNRGHGIQISRDIDEITRIIERTGKGQHTYIIQKYIENPLLINKRKFDIRMYGLMTSINGLMKGYFYEEGYIRTSSREYTLKKLTNKIVHLTNDAVQQRNEDYGKYEPGNKLSFAEFQKFIDANYPSLHIDFYRDILPSIKVLCCVKE